MHHLPCEWERGGGEGGGRRGGNMWVYIVLFFSFFSRGVKRRVYVISVAKLDIFSPRSGQVPTHALKGGGWRQMRLWRVSWGPGRAPLHKTALVSARPAASMPFCFVFFVYFPTLTRKLDASFRSSLWLFTFKTFLVNVIKGQSPKRARVCFHLRWKKMTLIQSMPSSCLVYRTTRECWGNDPTWPLLYTVHLIVGEHLIIVDRLGCNLITFTIYICHLFLIQYIGKVFYITVFLLFVCVFSFDHPL